MGAVTRQEVVQRLKSLCDGTGSREEIASWAERIVVADDTQGIDLDVWEAIKFLASADSPSTDRDYLYHAIDFESELRKLISGE